MNGVRAEDGILKVVHPGGSVEIHTRPILASQVMNRNPRHLVTRPDVFKFPWIVVDPDALLNPGHVFYIVPYRTIYRLLRDNENNVHGQQHQRRTETHEKEDGLKLKSCLKKGVNAHRTNQNKRVTFSVPSCKGCTKM
ncbi:hypothetical protein AMTR_s00163p00076040 [Amborella trichopoda]|uniref:Uncharacterized protein n=1 Tax=Amborella trichopoda TaxID=13333 RepID=W1PGD7_AMBTC|nr:hypothetical protein AMTR_s00163p00076040 [Amborella trichopoda]